MAVALIVAAGSGERLGCQPARRRSSSSPGGRCCGGASRRCAPSRRSSGSWSRCRPACGRRPRAAIGVAGGAVRSESVRRALAAAGPAGRDDDRCSSTTRARPLVTAALVEAVLAALAADEASTARSPRRRSPTRSRRPARTDGGARDARPLARCGRCRRRRSSARRARAGARRCPTRCSPQATDDAWLVERAGGRVGVVAAPRENLKVTTPLDLRVAEPLLATWPREPD